MTDEHTEDCPHCGEDISETVGGLFNSLKGAREDKKEAIRKLRALQDHSVSQEEYDALVAELEAAKADTVPRSEFESLTTEFEASKAQTAELREEATTGKIAAAVAKHGGNLNLLSPMIKLELASNPDLDLDEHVAALKNDGEVAGAFKASDHSGGGSDAGAGRNHVTSQMTQMTDLRQSTMTEKERNEFQKKHGLDALLNLPL